jgi:hypothetical protein
MLLKSFSLNFFLKKPSSLSTFLKKKYFSPDEFYFIILDVKLSVETYPHLEPTQRTVLREFTPSDIIINYEPEGPSEFVSEPLVFSPTQNQICGSSLLVKKHRNVILTGLAKIMLKYTDICDCLNAIITRIALFANRRYLLLSSLTKSHKKVNIRQFYMKSNLSKSSYSLVNHSKLSKYLISSIVRFSKKLKKIYLPNDQFFKKREEYFLQKKRNRFKLELKHKPKVKKLSIKKIAFRKGANLPKASPQLTKNIYKIFFLNKFLASPLLHSYTSYRVKLCVHENSEISPSSFIELINVKTIFTEVRFSLVLSSVSKKINLGGYRGRLINYSEEEEKAKQQLARAFGEDNLSKIDKRIRRPIMSFRLPNIYRLTTRFSFSKKSLAYLMSVRFGRRYSSDFFFPKRLITYFDELLNEVPIDFNKRAELTQVVNTESLFSEFYDNPQFLETIFESLSNENIWFKNVWLTLNYFQQSAHKHFFQGFVTYFFGMSYDVTYKSRQFYNLSDLLFFFNSLVLQNKINPSVIPLKMLAIREILERNLNTITDTDNLIFEFLA